MPRVVAQGDHFDIIARDDPPAFVLSLVVPIILKHQHIVPRWCRTVAVRWTEEGDYTLETSTSTEYRWASIRVNPSWLNDTPAEMEECLIHELIHIPMERTVEFTQKLLTQFVADETTRKFLDDIFRAQYEATVEDLARGIYEGHVKACAK